MIHFDPTITVGNFLTVVTIVLAFAGMWLRSEKLLATLSVRVTHAENRLDGHDGELNANHEQWIRHLTNKSA